MRDYITSDFMSFKTMPQFIHLFYTSKPINADDPTIDNSATLYSIERDQRVVESLYKEDIYTIDPYEIEREKAIKEMLKKEDQDLLEDKAFKESISLASKYEGINQSIRSINLVFVYNRMCENDIIFIKEGIRMIKKNKSFQVYYKKKVTIHTTPQGIYLYCNNDCLGYFVRC